MNIIDKLKQNEIKQIFLENNIEHIYLIGSFSRGDENKNSDIDIVYKEGRKSIGGLFTFLKMKKNLEEKLGRKMDLVEEKSINKHYKPFIEKDKILIF